MGTKEPKMITRQQYEDAVKMTLEAYLKEDETVGITKVLIFVITKIFSEKIANVLFDENQDTITTS